MTSPSTADMVAIPLACGTLSLLPHSQPGGSQLTACMVSSRNLVVVREACVNLAGAHFVRSGRLRASDDALRARIDLRKPTNADSDQNSLCAVRILNSVSLDTCSMPVSMRNDSFSAWRYASVNALPATPRVPQNEPSFVPNP